ncbi:RMP1 [Candida margitis]|uniref:RMP1 n=1 Tax=Candida margitis TaxID=1775924 RepID=UPI002227FA6D|nr:RMP1 [Candida margitis]KAI5969635.1 RMP1 [Candida margitis]
MDNQIHADLLNEYEILNILHHRSKNQHRQQHWFKYLNIIYRNLRKLLKLQIDIDRLQNTPKYRLRIEHKQSQMVKLSNKIIQVSRSAYWAYNSILVLGQYITLGFALIGNLAKIVHLVQNIDGVNVKRVTNLPASDYTDTNLSNVGNMFGGDMNEDDLDDLGEEIAYDEDDTAATPENEATTALQGDANSNQTRQLNVLSLTGASSGANQENEKNKSSQPPKVDHPTSSEPPNKSKRKHKPAPPNSIDDIFAASSKKKKKSNESKKSRSSKKSSRSAIDDIFS